MTRVVLDANVLASGFAGFTSQSSTPGELLRRWRREEFVVVYSSTLLEEVEKTLDKPYFRQRQTAAQRRRAVALVRHYGELTALSEPVKGVAPDPTDDHVLSAAISAKVAYLVTGDRALRSVGTYQGVEVVTPHEFLEFLKER